MEVASYKRYLKSKIKFLYSGLKSAGIEMRDGFIQVTLTNKSGEEFHEKVVGNSLAYWSDREPDAYGYLDYKGENHLEWVVKREFMKAKVELENLHRES